MDQLIESITYNKCSSETCTFFVRSDEEFCPNCGVKYKLFKPRPKALENKGCLSLLFALFGLSSVPITVSGLICGLLWLIGFSIPIYLLSAIIVGPVIFFISYLIDPPKIIEKLEISLIDSMEKLEERLNQIGVKRQKLNHLIENFDLDDDIREEKIKEKLIIAVKILAEQSSRYQVKIKEIDFLRWQNQIAPIISRIRSQTYEGAESDLKRISELAETGRSEYDKLTDWVSTLEYSATGKDLQQRFGETLDSCVRLRDALLERQAMLAIKDVTPIGEDNKSLFIITPELIRKVEAFNAEASLKDFTFSMDELDEQFAKLEIEDKLSSDTRLLIDQTEKL